MRIQMSIFPAAQRALLCPAVASRTAAKAKHAH